MQKYKKVTYFPPTKIIDRKKCIFAHYDETTYHIIIIRAAHLDEWLSVQDIESKTY
jgi:hypothetical protein